LTAILALGEKEETWDKMEKALIRFAGVTRGGGYKHLPLFTDGIGRKGCASKVAECVSLLNHGPLDQTNRADALR
jgi:hypothetical protein